MEEHYIMWLKCLEKNMRMKNRDDLGNILFYLKLIFDTFVTMNIY